LDVLPGGSPRNPHPKLPALKTPNLELQIAERQFF
jgi:hypothetical protein